MTLSPILAFAVASILIELTPGPNMSYLALVAASRGWRPGIATVVGVALGLTVIGVAAALGLTAIIQTSPALYETLRYAGVLFLLYLSIDGWIDSGRPIGQEGDGKSNFMHFRRGLITNLLNPKAAVFYVTVLPTFLPPAPTLADTLLLTAIYVAVATAIHALIVLMAAQIAPLVQRPHARKIFGRILSALLAAVAIWFFVGSAR